MHSTDDLNDGYMGSGQRLWHSLNKYGRDQHRCEVLEHCETREQLRERERQLVTGDLLKHPSCLNLALGGAGPPECTAKTSLKISIANSGKKRTNEQRRRYSEAAKMRMAKVKESGAWEQIKRKNAEAHLGKVQSSETVAKRNASLAAFKRKNGQRVFSEQARLNISQAQLGKKRGPYKRTRT